MIFNLNGKQLIAIIAAVLSVLVVSTAQLTELFGPVMAKSIVTIAGLANAILTSVIAALTGQASIIKDTLAMPGVESVKVNTDANKTLATIAIDPHQDKISPVSHQMEEVKAIAEGDNK